MTAGSTESFVFYLVIFFISVFLWSVLFGLFKVRSLGLVFALGYVSIVLYAVFKGWRPLEIGAFAANASEAVTFTWPATLLLKYLKHNMYFIVMVVALLQYCIAGWIVETMAGSLFGKAKKP